MPIAGAPSARMRVKTVSSPYGQDEHSSGVHQAYNAAYRVLDDAYQAAKKKLEEDAKAPKDEEDFDLTSQIIDYEENRWIEQQEALAAMALTLLASLTKSFLDEQKRRNLDKTHPPDKKGYGGGSELQKRVTEYNARFGVDLEKIECFETLREVELARSCCVHQEGKPNDDYLKKTQKRLLDERDNITATIFFMAAVKRLRIFDFLLVCHDWAELKCERLGSEFLSSASNHQTDESCLPDVSGLSLSLSVGRAVGARRSI
jgi:hypothetical protein